MPNGNTHFVTGLIAGGVTSLVLQKKIKSGDFDPAHAFLSTAIGGVTARTPDVIEPANHPNHRGFFHSYFVGFMLALLGKKLYEFLAAENVNKREEMSFPWGRFFAFVFLVAIVTYLVHLALDAFTPKGLRPI